MRIGVAAYPSLWARRLPPVGSILSVLPSILPHLWSSCEKQQMSSNSLEATATDTDSTTTNVISIDGSTGEGGGQILRNAISYATILQKPVQINNIRAKRTKPGLKAQHVASLQLPVELCGGTLVGDTVGSGTITYTPATQANDNGLREQKDGDFSDDNDTGATTRAVFKDIGTAGSICLLLQASLPCALFLPTITTGTVAATSTKFTLVGGTNAAMAPQFDYWYMVFLPILQQQCELVRNTGQDFTQAEVECRGFFPRGGGKVHVTVESMSVRKQPPLSNSNSSITKTKLKPIRLVERGELKSIYIRCFHAGKLPRHLAQDMAKAAKTLLLQQLDLSTHKNNQTSERTKITTEIDIVTERNAVGTGMGILIVATTTTGCKLAGSALSSPKKRANEIGREAAQELLDAWNSGGCVDEWLQDQLILFMALADGESEMLTGCLTLHTQTAIWTAEQFCPNAKFDVIKLESENPVPKKSRHEPADVSNYGQTGLIRGKHLIRCRGIGFDRT